MENSKLLQSNLSRKGSQRGGDMMIATSSAPMAEKSATAAAAEVALVVGSAKDHLGVQQFHHQITITTGTTAAPDEHALFRRNSFRRSSSSWFLDPKKVLLFFATVSCIGSMVLICFTLAIGKPTAGELEFH
ncbi:uncharacterized protein LOC111802598 isoform X1 [Cucurbita pepo subsp. pepo]|uniref:uncharacterized protein LOC111802598 isoform X1 n=1 Tax=Cucurbita pepo subsp. pepo TaxID=3664 RepID=UPI000C9D331F|nr:uncharacterized protein LOC111802598 isoform X1 [Cucurbita pepo subsp. pepo]